MKKILLFCILILIINGCIKNVSNDSENLSYLSNSKQIITKNKNKKIELPINYDRLETFLGNKFIPVYSTKENIDTDIDKEACIAYKINESSNINVVFFKFIKKNIIKKIFETETEIFDIDSFVFKADHLFNENDNTFVIEGKNIEGKNLLYIYSYLENEYKKVDEFTGDYSVIINYEENELEKGKYYLIREVEAVDNYFSTSNANVQEKKIYKWNTDEGKFVLAETSKLLYSSNLINPSIYSSEDKFLKYLNGFWYPEEYKDLIDNNSININDFKNNNIEFISFSSKDDRVSIKFEDYLNNYKILKIKRLWGNTPGLRMEIDETSELINSSRTDLEINLLDPNKLRVKGPNRYDERDYVRLPKPFIDYVNDVKNETNKIEIAEIIKKLQNEYKTDDEIALKFEKENEYILEKENQTEIGIFRITYDEIGYIISFLSETKNNILPYKNFIIKLSEDSEYFTLVPVEIKLNNFIVDDIRSITFYKQRGHG